MTVVCTPFDGRKVERNSGQVTVEYVLMLAAILAAFVIFVQAVRPIVRSASSALSTAIQSTIAPSDFHHLNVGH